MRHVAGWRECLVTSSGCGDVIAGWRLCFPPVCERARACDGM